MKKCIYAFGLSCVVLLSSCATIIKGTSEKISFNSQPQGAKVVLVRKNNQESSPCVTPCVTSVSKKTQEVKFELEGYYNEIYPLRSNSSMELWYLGNIILGGIPGMAVDLITGGYINLPDNVNVEMKKK